MNKNLRKTVIAGNWKMNKTPCETIALIGEIKSALSGLNLDGTEVVACVPYIDIATAIAESAGSALKIGAQNVHWAKSGAFTAEISAEMLKAAKVDYVIVGHSERRQYFGETDLTVNQRVRAAIDSGLQVILCVGELLEQREQGITDEIVSLQTKIALGGVSSEEMSQIIIAYEPVWAIGTGKTATSDQADEVCGKIREVLAGLYSQAIADATTIQYGGSMNAKNAEELLSKPNVDGGLIGGASLKAEDFLAIVRASIS